ncbi:hypothetical protein Tco_0233761 [Tanacetum coccineum]
MSLPHSTMSITSLDHGNVQAVSFKSTTPTGYDLSPEKTLSGDADGLRPYLIYVMATRSDDRMKEPLRMILDESLSFLGFFPLMNSHASYRHSFHVFGGLRPTSSKNWPLSMSEMNALMSYWSLIGTYLLGLFSVRHSALPGVRTTKQSSRQELVRTYGRLRATPSTVPNQISSKEAIPYRFVCPIGVPGPRVVSLPSFPGRMNRVMKKGHPFELGLGLC